MLGVKVRARQARSGENRSLRLDAEPLFGGIFGFLAVLGRLVPSADGDWWEATVPVGTGHVAFKIGGGPDPDPALLAHARDIVRSFPEFRERVAAFLAGEAGRLGPLGDEVRRLEVEDVCLFWPARPDDGMIFFRGPDDGRVWRCDYLGREPTGLGFDS